MIARLLSWGEEFNGTNTTALFLSLSFYLSTVVCRSSSGWTEGLVRACRDSKCLSATKHTDQLKHVTSGMHLPHHGPADPRDRWFLRLTSQSVFYFCYCWCRILASIVCLHIREICMYIYISGAMVIGMGLWQRSPMTIHHWSCRGFMSASQLDNDIVGPWT